jgi:alpha-N-acetylglucosaminidase
MAQADPGAVWLQMDWILQSRKQWTNARLSAMIGAVPPGRMVLIDYVCENQEMFRETHSFFGAPFIWDYLGNFGGNTYLVGPLNKINRRITAAMNDPSLSNMRGIGATLEGLNNPVVYEMLFDRVWAGDSMDLAAWVREEARARAGGPDPRVEQAWDVLREKVLVDGVDPIHGHGVVFQASNPSLRGDTQKLSSEIAYDNADLIRAWELLLQAGPGARASSAYRWDLVDTTRQALGNLGLQFRADMAAAYDRRDPAGFEKAAGRFMGLGRDIDRLLGTNSDFMLGKWIADARSWAASDAERAYYERDARGLITVWGGHLLDYAGRQWNGLLGDYYLPRWQMLVDATLTELREVKSVDRRALQGRWRRHELNFASVAGSSYATSPREDAFTVSRELFQKYIEAPAKGGAIDP